MLALQFSAAKSVLWVAVFYRSLKGHLARVETQRCTERTTHSVCAGDGFEAFRRTSGSDCNTRQGRTRSFPEQVELTAVCHCEQDGFHFKSASCIVKQCDEEKTRG